MRITRKEEVENPLKNAEGEIFSTNKHYHPKSEETYYFIRGKGTMIIDEKSYEVKMGDAVLIQPNEKHQLFADTEEIEAIVVCAPAWEINNTIFCED